MSEELINDLSQGLARLAESVTSFYADERNEEAFQKWLVSKDSKRL